jgi:uncharacterized protein YggE
MVMFSRSIPWLVVICSLSAGPDVASAQSTSPRSTVQVTEEATLTVAPDEARIDIGVTSRAATSPAAASQNARQASAVIDALRAAMGPGATIETVSYTVTPDIQPSREDGDARITGYTATNIVRVTGPVAQVGDIIDVALKAGANRIHRINFTLKDEQAAGAEALRAAVDNARSRAETLADALGVKIVRVLSATAGQEPVVRPFVAAMVHAADARVSTPVRPSTVEVRASVTLTLEIEATSATFRDLRNSR